MNNINNRLNWLFQDIARLRASLFNQLMEPHEISATHAWIIGALASKSGSTQSELASLLRLTRVAIGNALDWLEDAELVERRADDSDRRIWRVFLTRKARSLRKATAQNAATINEVSFDGLSRSERDQLIELLLRVRENLEDQTSSLRTDKSEHEESGARNSGRAARAVGQ